MSNFPVLWDPLPIPTVDSRTLVSGIQLPLGISGGLVFCAEVGVEDYYSFRISSGAAIDGFNVLSTTRGGLSRWLKLGTSPGPSAAGFECIAVTDKGAEANDSTDLGVPWQAANDEAMLQGGGAVCLPYDINNPRGTYRIKTKVDTNYAAPVQNFGADLVFRGENGGAPVLIDAAFGGGNNMVLISNPISTVSFRELSFIGGLTNGGAQVPNICQTVLYAISGLRDIVSNCDFWGIDASFGVLASGLCQLVARQVSFYGCSSETGAVIRVTQNSRGVDLEGVHIIDIGQLRSFPGSSGIRSNTPAGILIEDGAFPVTAARAPVRLKDVFVDEGYVVGADIRGNTQIQPWVEIDGFTSNVRTGGAGDGGGIGLRLFNVENANMRNLVTDYTSIPLAQGIVLESVKRGHVSAWYTGGFPGINIGAGATRLTADENCLYIRVEDSNYVMIDSRAKRTVISLNGVETSITQNAPTTETVHAEIETTAVVTVPGGGGTATVSEFVEHGAVKRLEWEVTCQSNEPTGSAAFRVQGIGTLTDVGGQATFSTPLGAMVNPTNTLPGDVSDAVFGASAVVLSAGATPTTRDQALLQITNDHTSSQEFVVRLKKMTQWSKFDPTQWQTLFGAFLVAYYDHTSLVDSAGRVATWRDLSGAHNDAIAAGAARPTYVAAAGPNLLPAARFDGLANILKATCAAFQQGTILTVGTFSAVNQTHVALSDAAGAFSAGGVTLRTIDIVGAKELLRRGASNNPVLTADLTGAYDTRVGNFYYAQANLSQNSTFSPVSSSIVPIDNLTNIAIGGLNDGSLLLAGDIQCVVILKQALPSPDHIDGGRLWNRLRLWAKAVYGTP